MTDPDNRDRVFALHVVHEGRDVPPAGWGLEVTPGIAGKGADRPFVQVTGGALLPEFFVMNVVVPPPGDAVIRLVYRARPDGITITTVWTEGMDAVQAIDALRRVAPIEVWNRLAIQDLARRLAMMQLNASGDGIRVLTALGMSEENARQLLRAYSAGPGAWPTFQPEASPVVPSDSPEWQTAMKNWRDHLESGGFNAAVQATTTRPNARRNRVTKEHLAHVATVYREAEAAGLPPTKAVEDAFQTSYSTATRWVGLARKEGELGPTQKGKSGELGQDESDE